jgi:hypothetical protein
LKRGKFRRGIRNDQSTVDFIVWTLVTAAYANTRYKETFHLRLPSIFHGGPDQAALNPNNPGETTTRTSCPARLERARPSQRVDSVDRRRPTGLHESDSSHPATAHRVGEDLAISFGTTTDRQSSNKGSQCSPKPGSDGNLIGTAVSSFHRII